ncbi:MAG: NADPH:quinone oxidoreductase family protein [Acidobacteria bacterium]|nr:NADPH:quinone oxidoreductase family protein [Acidobacteriota bacterium]
MKAWQVHQWCEPEALQFAELALPEPQPGEVRIRNRAAALNFFDILQIQGKYQTKPPLPFIPGAEVAGLVDAIGEGVSHLAIGDAVHASTLGAFAEYTIAKADRTFVTPASMSFDEAAAMYIVYQTSYFALTERAHLHAGEWLLVHSGAGGVGSAAVQLGKAFGAKIIATAGSQQKLDFCLAQGADHALNYNDDGWVQAVKTLTGGRGADVIYDPVGGDVFDLSSKCIASAGRLLVIGFAGGRIPTIAANRILLKNMSVVGCFWGGHLEAQPPYLAASQTALFKMYEDGLIKPAVAYRYPLAQAAQALRDLADRKTYGKVVLTME